MRLLTGILTSVLILSGLAVAPASADSMGHGHKRQQGMQQRFSEADKNGDGTITKEEFLIAAEARFSRMDQDGDGKILLTELPMRRHGDHGFHKPGQGQGQGPAAN